MKTIYNVYVEMESQEQCYRMKQVCVDNGLPIDNENIFSDSDIFRFHPLLMSFLTGINRV